MSRLFSLARNSMTINPVDIPSKMPHVAPISGPLHRTTLVLRMLYGPERMGPTHIDLENPPVELSSRLIAAYTQRYREAERWKAAAWVGSALLFITGLTLSIFGHGAATLGLIASAYLLCSRVVLRPEMTRAHREGVVLQEQFDVDLFSMPWNPGLAGRRVSPVDIEDLADRFRGDDAALSRWYVSGGNAPSSIEVLLRQLENATWGRLDHRRFSMATGLVLLASIGATIAVGLARDVTLATYVSAIAAPSLPWLLDLIDLTALHLHASARREEIEVALRELWDTYSNEPEPGVPASKLREIQDRIFGVRRSSGRVPMWFYRLYRTRNHRAIQAAVHRMLDERGWLDAT